MTCRIYQREGTSKKRTSEKSPFCRLISPQMLLGNIDIEWLTEADWPFLTGSPYLFYIFRCWCSFLFFSLANIKYTTLFFLGDFVMKPATACGSFDRHTTAFGRGHRAPERKTITQTYAIGILLSINFPYRLRNFSCIKTNILCKYLY